MPPLAVAVRALVPAFLSLVLPGRPVRALEFPPATGVGVFEMPGAAPKRLSVFAGYAYGTDSNFDLAPPGSEESSTFSETAAGVILTGGNALWGMNLSYRGRQDVYFDLDESYLRENRAALAIGRHTEKLHLGLRAKYAALEDPVDIEHLDRISRTKLAWAPQIALGSGKTELGLGYTRDAMRYDQAPRLDHDEGAIGAELRWWMAETNQIFVHYDTGSVEYLESYHSNFDQTRLYGGWRLDVPERAGVELGIGRQELSNFEKRPGLSTGGVFAVARVGLVGSGGTSRLEVACGTSDEQSATSVYKSVSMVELRYRRQATRRINWAVAARHEKADFEMPVSDPVTSLSRITAGAEINVDVGSLGAWHGRVFAKLQYGSRSGDSAEHEYARLRMLGGIGVVF